MRKTLLLLSFLGLAFLAVYAHFNPSDSIFWLASSSAAYQYARVALGFILLIQLFTDPPRRIWFRFITGVIAATALGWAIVETYSYHMLILDTLSIISATIAIGATSMERSVEGLLQQTFSDKKV
jgi:hypothetical protein